jgi:hypothetical protein
MAFTTPNDRIFYACQAVLVIDRNTLTGNEDPNSVNSKYLTGVQSIGVNTSTPSSSLLDVGRFQQQFHYYNKQEIEINIDRVIDKDSDFFYKVSTSNYQSGYTTAHMFYKDNINVQGAEADSKCVKNYDITLIYGTDSFSGVGADRNNSSGASDADRDKSLIVTYRNCLLTNISYTITTDGGITESVTLLTRFADYIDDPAIALTAFSSAQLPRADTGSPVTPGTPQSGDIVKGYDVKFRSPSDSRYNGTALRRQNSSDSSYFSILPDEVELMFDLSNSLNDLKITGINSISIGVSIDYTEITDVGRWNGVHDQDLQNLWRYVNLPVGVTASFTGTARQAFPHDMKNGSSLFTRAADFNSSLGKPSPTATDWNRVDRPILLTARKIVDDGGGTDRYFVWDLGEHNYLTDISTSGGDAGGGNVEVTMSYQNDFSEAVFAKHTSVINLSSDYDGPY